MLGAKRIEKSAYLCSNPQCGKGFEKPKIICVCPYCLTEIQEVKKSGCQNWFGYLGQREHGEELPKECIECQKSIECMLDKKIYSEGAVKEIKKWF
jgi:hypothetical protein